MPGFNAQSAVVGLVLLGVGFAGGYVVVGRTTPGATPGTTPGVLVSKPIGPISEGEIGPMPCVHFDGSQYLCPGIKNGMYPGDRFFVRGDSMTIDPIIVTYRGSRYILPIPARTDALFFTPEAGKILVEHYRVSDPARARTLQAQLDALPRP